MEARGTNLMDYTKSVYQSFKKVNGKYVIDTTAKGKWKDLEPESIQFLSDYLEFITNSGMFHKETLIWLDSVERRGIDAIRTYNDMHEGEEGFTPIADLAARNHMDHDKRKMIKIFPEDMLKNIYSQKADLEVYKAILQNAINKKLGKNILGNGSVLKTPCIISKEVPSEERIDEFFMLFAPYTKAMVHMIEEQLPKEVVGYINYISSKSVNTPEERELIARLNEVING